MEEILKLLKETSQSLVVLAVIAYFGKVYLEKILTGFAGRFEEIAKTSLQIKKDLRGEERNELVTLRVAILKWENFLQTAVCDFSMLDTPDAKVSKLYKTDKKLFLDVQIGVVKVGTYLRNRELEQHLMSTILSIRKTYYPLLNEAILKIIDLQAQLRPIEFKLNQFQQSGFSDKTYSPDENDRNEHLRLQCLITEEVRIFSENFLAQYRSIAEQMHDLKEAINDYVYRAINKTAINEE